MATEVNSPIIEWPVCDHELTLSISLVLSYKKSDKPRVKVPEANPPSLQYLGIGGEALNNATVLNPLTQLKPWSLEDSAVPLRADVTLMFDMKRLSSLEWALNMDPYKPFQELQRPLLFDPARASQLGSKIAPVSSADLIHRLFG